MRILALSIIVALLFCATTQAQCPQHCPPQVVTIYHPQVVMVPQQYQVQPQPVIYRRGGLFPSIGRALFGRRVWGVAPIYTPIQRPMPGK